MAEDIKYQNIAVLEPTKQRFIKQFKKAKKGKRGYFIDDYLNSLLDLESK